MGTEPMIKKLNASAISELPEQQTRIAEYSPERLSIQRFFFTDDSGVELTPSPSWNGAYIEVSMPMPDGSRKSKKFDFGKFLTYLEDSLKRLALQTMGDYLTKPQADEYYVLKKGDTMTGPLKIENATDTSLVVKNGINVESGTVTAPNIMARESLTSSKTTTLNDVTANDGMTVQTGNFAVTAGTTTLNGAVTINANVSSGEAYTATFGKVVSRTATETKTLKVETSAEINSLTATGSTTVQGSLTANGDAAFKGTTTTFDKNAVFNGETKVAASGVMKVEGNIQLTDTTGVKGKIIAGTGETPYIQGREGKIFIDQVTIGTYTGSGDDSIPTALTVNGNVNCTKTGTRIRTDGLQVVTNAEFESKVKADNFEGHEYRLTDTVNVAAGLSDGGGKLASGKKGLWQTTPQIAELTAKAACWS